MQKLKSQVTIGNKNYQRFRIYSSKTAQQYSYFVISILLAYYWHFKLTYFTNKNPT